VIFKFTKSSRLLRRSEYKRLYHSSTTIAGKYLVLDYCKGTSLCPRLGITVTKKYGKSHDRNRFKRLVREAFRKTQSALPEDLEINVRPRVLAKQANALMILEEFLTLLKISLP
jgi:ribonuclease P protein component